VNTKTVRLDEDTRRIMLMCSIEQVNDHWTLGLPQLDRPDYEKAKKALTALGCIWNRKAGTHICNSDPTEAITGIGNGENIVVEQYDYFPTPTELVARMIDEAEIEPGMLCHEPEAGDGRIALAMLDAGGKVSVCEINWNAQQVLANLGFPIACADFLDYNPDVRYNRIVMNPPFSHEQDIKHVMHAYKMLALKGRIVAIMSEHTFFASTKLATEFREWLSIGGWDEKLPADTFKESGTGVNTRLVVINKPAILPPHTEPKQKTLW